MTIRNVRILAYGIMTGFIVCVEVFELYYNYKEDNDPNGENT